MGRDMEYFEAASVGATVELVDGRTVGFATFGDPDGTPVLWCHGGPGSRMEPAYLGPEATDAGLLLVGIDRPGYGMSTPSPGRTIAGWVPDALAVADELSIGRFAAVGESTGGAYALALAALVPARVVGCRRVLRHDGHALGAGAIHDEPCALPRRVGRSRPRVGRGGRSGCAW